MYSVFGPTKELVAMEVLSLFNKSPTRHHEWGGPGAKTFLKYFVETFPCGPFLVKEGYFDIDSDQRQLESTATHELKHNFKPKNNRELLEHVNIITAFDGYMGKKSLYFPYTFSDEPESPHSPRRRQIDDALFRREMAYYKSLVDMLMSDEVKESESRHAHDRVGALKAKERRDREQCEADRANTKALIKKYKGWYYEHAEAEIEKLPGVSCVRMVGPKIRAITADMNRSRVTARYDSDGRITSIGMY